MNNKSLLHKLGFSVLGLLAIKLISFPISAKIIERIDLKPSQRVSAVAFPAEAGISRYLVASNAPFTVISQDAIGDFDINIYVKGNINGTQFGTNAQRPGPLKTCSRQDVTKATKIYEAKRETAAKDGEILTQAIIIEIKYDKAISPKLRIIAQDKAKDLLPSARCKTKLS